MHAQSPVPEGAEESDRRVLRELGVEASRAVTHLSSTLGSAVGLLLPSTARSMAKTG